LLVKLALVSITGPQGKQCRNCIVPNRNHTGIMTGRDANDRADWKKKISDKTVTLHKTVHVVSARRMTLTFL